ncbi:MAG: ribonuclease HII [Candidatus Paceibacterota bacterium]
MKWVIGIDEVGRGPLAGPVYVCAVAMPRAAYKKANWIGLTDSKKMTAKNRTSWFFEVQPLKEKGFIKYEISSRTAAQIDKKGIAVCIRECIAENLQKLALPTKDCEVLLDGSLKAPIEYKYQKTIIKGDLHEKIISLASVIAKVSRDAYMVGQYKKYPVYGWDKNKGYGTRTHIAAIKKVGTTPLHRTSFLTRLLPQ